MSSIEREVLQTGFPHNPYKNVMTTISINKINPYYFCNVSLFQVHQIHQVDLIDMLNQKVGYEGKCYQYVLSLLNVFSRFQWLVPLERKTAHSVKVELKKIYDVHGIPDLLQSNNGKELKPSVKRYCQKIKIQMKKSLTICKLALRLKSLTNNFASQHRAGINWSPTIHGVLKQWKVYFGRKHNELVKCDRQFERRCFKLPKNVDRAYRNIAKRTVQYY